MGVLESFRTAHVFTPAELTIEAINPTFNESICNPIIMMVLANDGQDELFAQVVSLNVCYANPALGRPTSSQETLPRLCRFSPGNCGYCIYHFSGCLPSSTLGQEKDPITTPLKMCLLGAIDSCGWYMPLWRGSSIPDQN
jgi:hypothetical protein